MFVGLVVLFLVFWFGLWSFFFCGVCLCGFVDFVGLGHDFVCLRWVV